MLTWRYHLLSLVAVFLALGLGVLVGISLSDNGAVDTSQKDLVTNIQQTVNQLQARNDALGQDQATNQRYQDDSFPYIVGGHLQGKNVALITSDLVGDDIRRQLTSAVHAAGAQVISTTILNAHMDPAAVADQLKTAMKNEPAYASVGAASLPGALAKPLAAELSGRGGTLKLLPALTGLVDSTSGDYQIPADDVILVTRADDSQAPAYSELEKQTLLALKDLGPAIMGAEPSDAPRSEIPMFLSVDVSSVDNIDSRIGQVSAVYVLGGEKGSFGTKTTADSLIPILRNLQVKP